jgi:hypothetical protein
MFPKTCIDVLVFFAKFREQVLAREKMVCSTKPEVRINTEYAQPFNGAGCPASTELNTASLDFPMDSTVDYAFFSLSTSDRWTRTAKLIQKFKPSLIREMSDSFKLDAHGTPTCL